MAIKITKPSEPYTLDVKRLHLPGMVLSSKCPGCGAKAEVDLGGQDYLAYPCVGEATRIGFYHGCNPGTGAFAEWNEHVILQITIKPVAKEA